jgi:hypothetical protein
VGKYRYLRMGKKRKNFISPQWKQAIRIGVATAGTIAVAFLIFKAGLNIGFTAGRQMIIMPPKLHTTDLLVLEYKQLRTDI